MSSKVPTARSSVKKMLPLRWTSTYPSGQYLPVDMPGRSMSGSGVSESPHPRGFVHPHRISGFRVPHPPCTGGQKFPDSGNANWQSASFGKGVLRSARRCDNRRVRQAGNGRGTGITAQGHLPRGRSSTCRLLSRRTLTPSERDMAVPCPPLDGGGRSLPPWADSGSSSLFTAPSPSSRHPIRRSVGFFP